MRKRIIPALLAALLLCMPMLGLQASAKGLSDYITVTGFDPKLN